MSAVAKCWQEVTSEVDSRTLCVAGFPLKEGAIRSVLALVVASFARMVARLTALLATVICFSEVQVDHHDRPW